MANTTCSNTMASIRTAIIRAQHLLFRSRPRYDYSNVDITASDLINRLSFQAQQDISSVMKIAGETKKKLGTFASGIFSDLQDRML
ncbi:PREDICTED: probable ADP-ribosylation factor GTPase-activating protein AGD8 [Brassica oleracea var. oleracea]|uniref:probable ADP-ribosylation factor GTPase-activating protein AGD8 n=1 Tax=Brassica oleracea var. oleracea TaxID=109376 RepID=UPI0006A6B41F|nr:PREDICTED: probable ADP-ribosylation factor GTPase-activating protein AGD8 [Brassica oleracea var. oleracea]